MRTQVKNSLRAPALSAGVVKKVWLFGPGRRAELFGLPMSSAMSFQRDGFELDERGGWRADRSPRDSAVMLREWLVYGVARVPGLHAEVLNGRSPRLGARVLRDEPGSGADEEFKPQQPSLFDFARRNRDVLLDRRP